ncbi:MAG: class I SAM-dependent methyltransferase [bacterium]
MMYKAFARIYDMVMRDVDYSSWVQHLENLCRRHKFKVKKILDLACGSGGHALLLLRRGYEVVGVDGSLDMIAQAKRKMDILNRPFPIYHGKMECFAQDGVDRDFDLVVCLYDSLNYVLEDEAVQACFQEVYSHLRPGGGFIFDVTSEYNLLENFAGYTFAENFDDYSYIWENEYSIETKICSSRVTVFQQENGQYEKCVEVHNQRVYPIPTLKTWLEKTGFEILGIYHDTTEEPVKPKAERIHFVARRD